ncbi:MAG: hypothetical protein KKA42_03000 [candidate division Zixibacteria bacterium]|nr:hypothetical protein [candidate division Zixibacteria bacterium]
MKPEGSPQQRLRWFVDAVLMEERKFRLWNRHSEPECRDLEAIHNREKWRHDHCGECHSLRREHEAIFDDHQKRTRHHHRIVQDCEEILRKLNRGKLLSEDDLIRAIETMARHYDQIRRDHNRMQKERQQVLEEHRQFMSTHGAEMNEPQ